MQYLFSQRRWFLALVFLGFFAGMPTLEATSYVLVSDPDLADQAELIVRAEITDVGTSEASGPITTDYRLLVDEVIKGEAPAASIVVRMLGGELEDAPGGRRGLFVWGIPVFEPAQRVLFFLGRNPDGSYHVLHLFQGAFRELDGLGESVVLRSLEEALRLPSPDSSAEEEPEAARSTEGFVAWLRDRAQGFERPRDYVVARPELPAAYTLLGDGVSRLFRWFEFDTGGQIVWHRHDAGQRGLGDGGLGAFAVAMRAWNDEPSTPVRYVDGGTTSSATAFNQRDGLNTILFSDLSNSIMTGFSCNGGGTVAVGGVSFAGSPTRPWRGRAFEPTLEAEIVVNDGVECYFNGRPDRAEEAYAHELGHTLGLGHACGDPNSPACSASPAANEALMRANLHNDRRGALLNRDDRAGLRYLYDPAFNGADCPWPPGHPDYCRDCGPCGAEEGDCDTQAECMPALSCISGRGAELGFPANTDVCLASGSGGGCTRALGDRRFCRDCGPCAAGEGGCRSNAECAAGLVCEKRAGGDFGFDPKVGVCVAADPECSRTLGNSRYCRDCGPCRRGEGGCRRDTECGGVLVCVKDSGAEFGLPAKTDVCQ